MRETAIIRKWGIGSIALIISIFSIMFSFTYVNGKYLGQHLLNTFGITFPYIIISLILFGLSVFIGYKNKEDRYAKAGMILSISFIVLIVVLSITSTLI